LTIPLTQYYRYLLRRDVVVSDPVRHGYPLERFMMWRKKDLAGRQIPIDVKMLPGQIR